MAIGKYLSLEEARKKNLLDRFCKEHPSKADQRKFKRLLEAMTTTPQAKQETSSRACPDSYSETQTLSDTPKDNA